MNPDDVIDQGYVGDGVYVEFYADGGFKLWTNRTFAVHEIFFEPDMLEHLTQLRCAAMAKIAQTAEQPPK